MKKLTQSKGFSTLLIVIILGGAALTLTLTLSASSVWTIRGSSDSRLSNITKALVNSCAEVALEALREKNSHVGTYSVVLNNNTCSYTVTNSGGNSRSISASATLSGITRKLFITTSSFNPLTVSSWQEIP